MREDRSHIGFILVADFNSTFANPEKFSQLNIAIRAED